MNRMLRNSLAFLFGFCFSSFIVTANAETIPATPPGGGLVWLNSHGYPPYETAEAACRSSSHFKIHTFVEVRNQRQAYGKTIADCWGLEQGVGDVILITQVSAIASTAYTCPTGQNWTLAGQTCTRPDCVAPQTRQSDGTCSAPKCKAGDTSTARYYTGRFYVGLNPDVAVGIKAPTPISLCDGQCTGSVQTIIDCEVAVNASPQNPQPVVCTAGITLTGAQCTGDNGAAPTPPTVPSNAPPCAPGQGVISSGTTVKCVDPGQVDGTTNPPKVNKTTETKTHPDGSQTINNITQTCTAEGACSTTTTTTTTNASNGQPGIAGTPGTTKSEKDKPVETQSDLCAQNPSLQICKGGMATEVLQKETLDEIKKINNPTASDDSSISSKTFESTPGRSDLTTHDDSLKNYVIGAVVPGEVAASKGAWETAMSSGWFEPIERGGCQPYVATIAGKTWTWDYCQKADEISKIGAYALWVSLAFGIFVMLTGGQRS